MSGVPHGSIFAVDVISREHAVKLAGPREVFRFRRECLRHYSITVKGMRIVHRAMRRSSPEGVVVLASLFERLLSDLRPCTCMVTRKMGMVCGEDDCAVHGFGS